MILGFVAQESLSQISSWACTWCPFSVGRGLVLTWHNSFSLVILHLFVLFGCCLIEACSFLVREREWIQKWGELEEEPGEVGGGESVIRINWIRINFQWTHFGKFEYTVTETLYNKCNIISVWVSTRYTQRQTHRCFCVTQVTSKVLLFLLWH